MAVAGAKGTEETVVTSEKSIELLNKSVADELAAVHQYMYFHFHLEDLGFAPVSENCSSAQAGLSGPSKASTKMEMGHVESLAERILFLKGGKSRIAVAEPETRNDDHRPCKDAVRTGCGG